MNYTMDFPTKTLTITTSFEKALSIPNSKECSILAHYRSLCPDLQIRKKTHCTKSTRRKSPYKRLTYKNMERYIGLFDNAAELYTEYHAIKSIAELEPYPYGYVFDWFIKTFPDYRSFPEIINGKIKHSKPADIIDLHTAENTSLPEAV